MPKAKVYWEVRCDKHGTKSTDTGLKHVKVSPPKNKREQRKQGCPMCRAEENLNQ